jgi:hypothetical protein
MLTLSSAAAAMSVATATMVQGEVHTTLYPSDPSWNTRTALRIDNWIVDAVIRSADRNLISTATTPLSSTRPDHVRRFHNAQSLQVLGDVPTPPQGRVDASGNGVDRHGIPVDGYDRGNHSSSNAYGVINPSSRLTFSPAGSSGTILSEDVCRPAVRGQSPDAEGDLSADAPHLHRHHPNPPPIEEVSTWVKRADLKKAIRSARRPPRFVSPREFGAHLRDVLETDDRR